MKDFKPTKTSSTPWKVREKIMWHSIEDCNGKTVAKLRNILDAKLIVELINERKVKYCPKCKSYDIIMFTSDLDLCQKCGYTF